MASWIRRIVSGQKKRFQDDGFDLDLAYISPRIIAMGLPADAGKELLFRNPMPEIARFLRHYHRNHAKVFNLCSEHTYSQDKLLVALQHYPFDDHQTPALVVVQQFCADAAAWLAAHPRNVVVVHCKAGKGRTGIMICCLLLYLHLNAPHLPNLEPAAAAAAAAGQPGGSCDEGNAACSDSSSSSSLASIDSSGGRGSQGWHPWQSVEPVQLSRLASPARDVLALYAERRTHDGNGVTIASQRRYVAYFWRVLASGPRPCGSLPARRTLQLRQLVISGLPPGVADSCVVAVEARPSGSTAPSATRVLVVPGPRALSSGMAGVCLAPCVSQPLVRDDGCRIVIASSATAGDTLTLTMPAASMGLSELSSKQQQQAAPGCCGACSCGTSCLGAGARLSPAAVAPAAAAEGGAGADAAVAYGLAGEWVPAAGCPAAAASDQDASEAAGDQQQGCCVVEGDVRILVLRGGSRLFYTWFNTGLLPPGNCYSLTRAQLDKPAKGLPEQLQLTVRFVDLKPHADEEDEELSGGARLGQQQPDDGMGTPGTPRLLPPGASGWVGLGKRLLTTSSHKRPAVDGAGGAKRSGRGGGASQGRPAAAAVPEAHAGAEACGSGASASKRAKRAAPLVLTGSSSSSALAAMGQQQQQPAQRQPVQGSVSAPASPHSVGRLPVGKLSRSSSWKWQQHLPAISSISGSLWDWAGAAGSVAEDGEGDASPASFRGLQPQSRLSWDWDWPSLAAPAAAQQAGFDGLAAGSPPAALPALASAISAPALLDACARAAPLAAQRVAAGKRSSSSSSSSSSGVSGRYRPIQQDLHTSGLSRSPAAIELPCLRRLPGTSTTVDALLDPPAVTLAASPQLRGQQQQAAAANSLIGRAGAAGSAGSGGTRKPGPSLWQLLLREPGSSKAGLSPGSAAGRAATAAAAAARAGEVGDEDDDDGGDTYPVADVPARPGASYSRRLLQADASASAAGGAANGSGGGPAAGTGDSLQGLLDALNWSTDTWQPVGAAAAGGAGAGSSWQQRQRRHTYSGPRGIHGTSSDTSSGTSSPVARRQALKKVHSAPNTPPGLASLSGDQQEQRQHEGWAAAAAAGPRAQQLTSRLLDLDLGGADEASSLAPAAAHSSAVRTPCCVDCMFGLHASPCPAAPSSAAAAASSAAAVALMSAAAAGGGGGVSTSPLQSVRSCPLQPAGSTCDADVRVTAIPCNPGGGVGGKRGGSRGRRGEASEQLQALLAAAGDECDDAGGPAALPGNVRSSGEPDALSLTQQWKQLEKAWQRSWCV